MIEVTNNVFSTGRVRRVMPNFFGQRGQILPEEVRVRMMSRGLMGLGAVDPTQVTLITGLTFTNANAKGHFFSVYGADGGCDGREGVWTPLSAGQINSINGRLDALQAAADYNPQADATRSQFIRTANSLAATVSASESFGSIGFLTCGRSDAGERQYRSAMRSLKAHLLTGMSLPIPKPLPVDPSFLPGGGGGGGGGGSTGSKGAAITGEGIPTWAKALGGVVLLGGVTYALMKVGRK